MKRFIPSALIVTMAAWTIGCGNQEKTTKSKTEVTTSQTSDGEKMTEKTTTVETETTVTPSTAAAGGTTTTKTTETTTETATHPTKR